MKTFDLNLTEFFNLENALEAKLTCYFADQTPEIDPKRKRPSILILPGGAYIHTSDREAEPIALNYLSMGFNAFILRYSCAPARYPQALLEASAAVALMRKKSDEWFVDPDKIAVIGFSAGGHLAASLSTLWNEEGICETLGIEKDLNKPNATILSYPVITSNENHAHKGSFIKLLGENASDEMKEKLSLEKRVTKDTPPTFIWHTANDNAVPVMNSILFAEALAKNKVPFELHIFPNGVHGLSNCNITSAYHKDKDVLISPYCERWMEFSKKWLFEILGF